MHVKCNGLNRASDHDENFGCIRCTSLITDNTTTDIQAPPTQLQQAPSTNYKNLANATSNETITATPDPWSNPTPEKNYKIKTIYSQVVHRKTVFMILAKNRIGFNFIETLKRTLNSLTETQENTYAMHATMIFPHIMLCKTKSESDGSNSLTIARRLKQWHKGKQDNFFWKSAANALGKGQAKESRN